MHNSKLDNIKFKALKQHVRAQINDEIRFSLQNKVFYNTPQIADFIAPAIRNLGLLGAGLGGVKGALEPSTNEVGMPVSLNERIGGIASNALVGGIAGAGAGAGYKALKPGLQSGASKLGQAIEELPQTIEGKPDLLERIQDVAVGDLASKSPSRAKQTFGMVQRRAKRDIARSRRFLTGKGAGIETVNKPVGTTKTIIRPDGTKQQEFIPKVDKFGDPVTESIEKLDPNMQLDEISNADRIASSIAGGTAGAVAGIPLAAAGGAAGTGAGALVGGALGIPLGIPGIAAGAALGAKTGAALGTAGGAIAPAVIGGYKGASKGLKGGAGWVKDKATKDIARTKEAYQQVRDFLPFEYPEYDRYGVRKISTFGVGNSYKTLGIGGAVVGGGIGAASDVASTLNRQQDREEQEINDIYNIDNPYVRMGTYQDYTSQDQSNLRKLRNSGDVLARGALGLGVGAGVGLGIGGLGGHLIDANKVQKTGLLQKLYGR